MGLNGHQNGNGYKVIGSRPVRPDVDKVTGRHLLGRRADGRSAARQILRSPHGHAIVKSIDTSAAEALPGVKR
ncbi:MAG: hypothetical protein R2856_31470 [Caldilineaceae bacterium]